MSKKLKKLAITGNKLIDGLISLFIFGILLSAVFSVTWIYGYPSEWYKFFGAILASFYVGLYGVAILGIFIFFTIGVKNILSYIFEEVLALEIVDTKILITIIYISGLVVLTTLVLKGIAPYNVVIYYIDKYMTAIISAICGFILGVAYTKLSK
jgi:hypothetical protein